MDNVYARTDPVINVKDFYLDYLKRLNAFEETAQIDPLDADSSLIVSFPPIFHPHFTHLLIPSPLEH